MIQWRFETEGQRVGPICAHLSGCLKDRLAEHVAMLAELLSVKPDRRERVQPMEDKLQPLLRFWRFLVIREPGAIPLFALLDPTAVELVAVVERVCDSPGVNPRPMDIPRHRNIDPVIQQHLQQRGGAF
jgi:hypothetical protein